MAQIGPAVYYLTTPIHSQLAETITATVDVLRATPLCLLCLLTLVISMAFVCDGFRAADESIGGRIALTGVAGAVASMYFRYGDARSARLTRSLIQSVVPAVSGG